MRKDPAKRPDSKKKIVLSIHKNTKEQRASKKLRKDLIADAKELTKMEGISGYSIVVWNKDCQANCSWTSTPPVLPGLVVPEFSKQILNRRINCNDTNNIIDMRID